VPLAIRSAAAAERPASVRIPGKIDASPAIRGGSAGESGTDRIQVGCTDPAF
jgi:hypothetical protein